MKDKKCWGRSGVVSSGQLIQDAKAEREVEGYAAIECERQHYVVLNKSVKVYVADDGIGIDPSYTNSVFEEGFRTDDSKARYPVSSGLGLSVAIKLMGEMNGSIRFLPDCKMTTFEVQLQRKGTKSE